MATTFTGLECDNSQIADSLPQLTDLLKVQSLQLQSFEEKHKKYKLLQDIIQKERVIQSKLKEDTLKVSRKLRILEETEEQLTTDCVMKQTELEQLVIKIHQQQLLLKKLQQEKNDHQTIVTEYNSKMVLYKNNILDKWNTKLEEKIVEEKIQLLKREIESNDVMVNKEETSQQLDQTKQQKQTITKENNNISTKLQHMEVIINGLKNDIVVAKKRNHAQLTRLRHQLQEAQGKRYQWQQDKEKLTNTIKKMKKLSEE